MLSRSRRFGLLELELTLWCCLVPPKAIRPETTRNFSQPLRTHWLKTGVEVIPAAGDVPNWPWASGLQSSSVRTAGIAFLWSRMAGPPGDREFGLREANRPKANGHVAFVDARVARDHSAVAFR